MNVIRIAWCVTAFALLGFALFESVKYGWVAAGVFVVFAILPDMPILRGFQSNGIMRVQYVRLYNILHSTWIPLALMLSAMLPLPPLGWGLRPGLELFLAGIAWLLHISIDRAVGFGMRERDGTIRPVGTRGRLKARA